MYFEIKVHAKSEEELSKRIKDNESRGFKLIRRYDYLKGDGAFSTSSSYTDNNGRVKRVQFDEPRRIYGAIMRRKNNDRGRVELD